jgi:hypothetical protein
MKNKINKKITLRYLPKRLTLRDKKLQYGMLMKSRKLYKKGKYFTRKALVSYKSRPSNHVTNATRLYGVKNIGVTNELARATGCSKESLGEIVKKGEGAYFSSGSRPNQTAQSWGLARLASSLTSGKSAAVDFDILEKGCNHKKKAFILAKKSRKRYKFGHGKTKKVSV